MNTNPQNLDEARLVISDLTETCQEHNAQITSLRTAIAKKDEALSKIEAEIKEQKKHYSSMHAHHSVSGHPSYSDEKLITEGVIKGLEDARDILKQAITTDQCADQLAVATGSLPLYTVECRNLLYAAKLIEAEATTWAEGWAVREKDGSLKWDKPDEWAHVRWHHLCVAAKNLRAIAARFTKKTNL